ncbi:MAG: glycosyltransferase family 39 protein [Anaerolineae bacterium]|nr:glycosyltransferase family 39 protein [Anaerolineae bacterium]
MKFLASLHTIRLRNQPGHWVLLCALIGFGLRLQRLDFQPLWGDEGWSFYFAGQSLPQLLALTAIDIHPPLYYIVLKLWLWLAGVGPEEARVFSVFTGTLLIPTLYGLGRRLFGDARPGVAGVAVAAVMPLAIYYSQEVRMYQLVTLLGALSIYCLRRWQDDRRRRWLAAYVLVTMAALYTHYYAALLVLGQGLYLLLRYLLAKRESKKSLPSFSLLASLSPLLWVGAFYLPWLIYLGPRLTNYVANKADIESYIPLDIVRFLGDHFVAFSIGHLPNNLQQYIWAALPFVIVAALGLIAVVSSDRPRRSLLLFYLLTPLALGYLINLVFPFTPPFFERTLLLAAPAYWLLIGAGIIWLWDRQYLLVGTFVLAMLLVINVSLIGFYTIPRYPYQDYRPLLKDIAARAAPDDTLLASYQWQLGYYYAYLSSPHARLFAVPGWGAGWAGSAGHAQLRRDLASILATSPRLWFPAHQTLGHVWENEAEAAMAELGFPALLEWYGPQTKLTLVGAPPDAFTPGPTANFAGRLSLLAASVGSEPSAAGRGIVPVELTWRKENSLGSSHLVSLRLAGAEGRTWAIRDSHPRASQTFFTDLAIGDTLIDRHGLLIPAGTPPGRYRLLLSIRRVSDAHPLDLLDTEGQPQGVELELAQVEVVDPQPPVGIAALPTQFNADTSFGQAARLVGYSLGNRPFKAGETLPLTLFWQSLADRPGPLAVAVQLQDKAGQPVVTYQRDPIRPSTDWQRDTLLRDPHDVPLPPALPPGEYHLAVGLVTPNQGWLSSDGSSPLVLTTVTTIDRPHLFEPPEAQIALDVNFSDQAKLMGLDLPRSHVNPGQQLPLTLYWQAIGPFERNWSVFVHLLNDHGQIVAQQDQIPGGGQFPTTGWLVDEYLTDPYNLLIPADTLPGQYWLEVGLYNANDFSRLPVIKAGEIMGDHVILESWPITVE